jgi:hypothetical protein
MREFEQYYISILVGLIIVYIGLCNYTIIHPIQHKSKLIITKCNTLSYEDKHHNFMLNACGFILSLLLIVFEINYISKYHNENIYIRGIEFIFVIGIIILINLPNEYKNNLFIKITNSIRPLSFIISTIFIGSITSINSILILN